MFKGYDWYTNKNRNGVVQTLVVGHHQLGQLGCYNL